MCVKHVVFLGGTQQVCPTDKRFPANKKFSYSRQDSTVSEFFFVTAHDLGHLP